MDTLYSSVTGFSGGILYRQDQHFFKMHNVFFNIIFTNFLIFERHYLAFHIQLLILNTLQLLSNLSLILGQRTVSPLLSLASSLRISFRYTPDTQ